MRKARNRISKLARLLIPLSVVLSVISLLLVIFMLQIIRKPLLISPVTLPFFDYSNTEDKYIAELKKILRIKNISYSAVNKLSDSVVIKLTNSREVIISSKKDLKQEISSLQYILSRLTMEGKDFARLDLRFDKPVIMLR